MQTVRSLGEVAEWSIAAVLKTVVLRGTRGSNPCLSALNKIEPTDSSVGFFYTFELENRTNTN